MRIAVFGASGFIGSNLVRRLLADGHDLRIFDHAHSQSRVVPAPPNVTRFTGDFATQMDFTEVIDGCDAVFHLISTVLPGNSNQNILGDIQENLIPTIRLVENMKSCGVSRIIFPSSGGTVYGEAKYLPIDEQHPTNPLVSYGITKLAIEKYLSIYQRESEIRPVCLRISNPYGPGAKIGSPQGAVGAFLLKALNGQSIEIWGDGEVRRDYIYVEDLMDAMVSSLSYEGNEIVFNISSGIGTSLNELLEIIETTLEKRINTKFLKTRNFDVQTNILNHAKAAQALNWRPTISMAHGIRITAKWLCDEVQISKQS